MKPPRTLFSLGRPGSGRTGEATSGATTGTAPVGAADAPADAPEDDGELQFACGVCNAILPTGAAFCGECGTPIDTSVYDEYVEDGTDPSPGAAGADGDGAEAKAGDQATGDHGADGTAPAPAAVLYADPNLAEPLAPAPEHPWGVSDPAMGRIDADDDTAAGTGSGADDQTDADDTAGSAGAPTVQLAAVDAAVESDADTAPGDAVAKDSKDAPAAGAAAVAAGATISMTAPTPAAPAAATPPPRAATSVGGTARPAASGPAGAGTADPKSKGPLIAGVAAGVVLLIVVLALVLKGGGSDNVASGPSTTKAPAAGAGSTTTTAGTTPSSKSSSSSASTATTVTTTTVDPCIADPAGPTCTTSTTAPIVTTTLTPTTTVPIITTTTEGRPDLILAPTQVRMGKFGEIEVSISNNGTGPGSFFCAAGYGMTISPTQGTLAPGETVKVRYRDNAGEGRQFDAPCTLPSGAVNIHFVIDD